MHLIFRRDFVATKGLIVFLTLVTVGEAQTRIDASTQTKTVDFSLSSYTKPIKAGTVIPASCGIGEAFYKTNAVAGNNVFWCTSTNSWTLQGAKLSGDYTASQVTNAVDKTQPATYTSGARQTFSASASTAGIRLVAGSLPSSPLSGDLAVDSADSALKIFNGAQWVAASSGGGGGGTALAGVGITVSGSPNQTIAIDTALVPAYLSTLVTLDFPAIGAQSCAQSSMTLSGATAGDAVAAGWPAALPAGLSGSMFVSGANAVTVRLCNVTASAVDPPNTDYRATIVRSF